MAFVSTLAFTRGMATAAAAMDALFEIMLRSVNLHQDVILALRNSDFTTRGLFVSIDSTAEV